MIATPSYGVRSPRVGDQTRAHLVRSARSLPTSRGGVMVSGVGGRRGYASPRVSATRLPASFPFIHYHPLKRRSATADAGRNTGPVPLKLGTDVSSARQIDRVVGMTHWGSGQAHELSVTETLEANGLPGPRSVGSSSSEARQKGRRPHVSLAPRHPLVLSTQPHPKPNAGSRMLVCRAVQQTGRRVQWHLGSLFRAKNRSVSSHRLHLTQGHA